MTMSDDRPHASIAGSLVLPVLIRPIIHKIEKKDPAIAQTLFSAIVKAETQEPGLLLEIVDGILRQWKVPPSAGNRQQRDQQQHDQHQQQHHHQQQQRGPINMTESLLKLQGTIPEFEENKSLRPEEPFQDLNRKSSTLKKILSRIPDEINDRKTFLETIKEIASAIKKLLDCVNEISNSTFIVSPSDKRALENRKRDFIRDSKKFSQTLKEFFREGRAITVYSSAAQLICATNAIQNTVKAKFDPK